MRGEFNKAIQTTLLLVSLLSIAGLVATSVLYLTWTGLGEQGEVQFASVSALLYQGYPLYTDIDAAGRYSLQHGPIVYIVAGAIMKLFGANYVTVKLAGAIAPAIALVISWFWFSKLTTKKIAILILGLQTLILFHWHHIFFIRPDSFMLLTMVVSMAIITTTKQKLWLIMGVAIPLGIMVNLKIHGILYFLPIFALAYHELNWRQRWYIVGIAALVGISPFLLPEISLTNYLMWVTQSVHHGFSFKNFIPKVAMIFMLSLIPFLLSRIYGLSLHTFYLRFKNVVYVLAGSILVIAIISSKSGSGTNHIIPYVPIFSYFMLMLANEIRAKEKLLPEITKSKFVIGTSYILLATIILAIFGGGVTKEANFFKIMREDNKDSAIILKELQTVKQLYAGKTIALGYGEDKSYSKYRNYIPFLVFQGNPLLLEAVAFMDMKLCKIPIPPATIKQLEDGAIGVWLIPSDEQPFGMNYGDKGPLFDASFRQAFLQNYHMVGNTPHFNIWLHKRVQG